MHTHADCKMSETCIGINTKDLRRQPGFHNYKWSKIHSLFQAGFPDAIFSIKKYE